MHNSYFNELKALDQGMDKRIEGSIKAAKKFAVAADKLLNIQHRILQSNGKNSTKLSEMETKANLAYEQTREALLSYWD